MTRDELDTLWQKALIAAVSDGEKHTRYHFAALVQKAERDACVEVCDNLIRHGIISEVQLRYNKAYEHCKDKIRARGEA